MEDILVGKLARNGVSDIRIREELPHGADSSSLRQPSAPAEERGEVEQALSEAASNLISSGRFVVSVQFTDGQWLNFITPVTPDPQILTGNTVPLYAGVAIAIVLLSLWAIRQLTAPYATLERAVKAIGDDLNRAPLPEAGSREVRAAARAINWMQRKLQEQVSEREHLAAALAHDLRTPVTRLRLRYEQLGQSKLKTMLIADLAEIEAIIRSVVDFASHELSDESEARIDLISLVESVCDDFPDATIDPASVASRIVCIGRPIALKRCLMNLIDNAVKYGGKAAVSMKVEANAIAVIVDDEGPGIPAGEIENVFKPFHRLDASRNRETGGIGLGLAIARGIARAHSGDICMYRRSEGGMRVILSIPRPGEDIPAASEGSFVEAPREEPAFASDRTVKPLVQKS